MKTGLFPKPYILRRWRRGAALCTRATRPSTFLPPRLQNRRPRGGRQRLPEPGVRSCGVRARALRDAPAPGDERTCLGCACHLREAVLQRLTSRCLAWLARPLLPSALPGAVCRQWNGLAEPAKLNTAGDVLLLAPPRHRVPGAGGWASVHPRGPASSLVPGSEMRGRRKGFKCDGETPGCWEEHRWEAQQFWSQRSWVVLAQQRGQEQSFGSCCPPSNVPVASPVPTMRSGLWGNWERRVSVSALRLHK